MRLRLATATTRFPNDSASRSDPAPAWLTIMPAARIHAAMSGSYANVERAMSCPTHSATAESEIGLAPCCTNRSPTPRAASWERTGDSKSDHNERVKACRADRDEHGAELFRRRPLFREADGVLLELDAPALAAPLPGMLLAFAVEGY